MNTQPMRCEVCGDTADITRWKRYPSKDGGTYRGPARHYCVDCDQQPADHALKSLQQLAADLHEHAYKYAFTDGQLVADLRQAANYLEAIANG
jgi:hypothetical protein